MNHTVLSKQSWRDIKMGLSLFAVAGPLLAVSILKGMYAIGQSGEAGFLSKLFQMPAYYAYTHTPAILSWVWRATPTPMMSFKDIGTWATIVLYVVVLIGIGLIRSGLDDQKRLARARREVQDQRLLASLGGQAPRLPPPNLEPDAPDNHFRWMMSNIVLPLALTVVGAALCKMFGLM